MFRCIVTLILFAGVSTSSAGAETTGKVKQPVQRAIETRQATQQQQDDWAENRARLQAEFKLLQQTNIQLEKRNRHLSGKIAAKENILSALEGEMLEPTRTSEELMPYLDGLLDELEALMAQDLPFLVNERQERIARVKQALKDDTIPAAEKFRRLMEALIIEAQYGNTTDVYSQKITLENQAILVDVLRLGRLSLFCLTPDGKKVGYYDPAVEKWRRLPTSDTDKIRMAVDILSKKRSVRLLSLPLGKVVVQ